MYQYGSPYVPMMYPTPYQPYPYMGPLVYRPHPGMYPTVGGKGQVRGAVPKQTAANKVKVPAQPVLPLQRDDEDHTESPRATPPKSATSKQQSAATGQTAKKSGQKRMVALNMMPRMPMYQPYFAYPQYMLPPDDARYMQLPQAPFYYTYPNMPRHPYPYMMPQPVHVQVQPRPGSGSVSPASSSEGAATKGNQSQSPTGSSQSDVQSMSPGSSTGQHIQLLPNVKHVPTHLLYGTPGSGNNSRSSTPVLSSSPAPQQQPNMSSDSPRTSQGEIEFPSFRRRQHSGPRPVSQSPSYSSQGSHESSASPVLNGDQISSSYRTETQTVFHSESVLKSQSKTSSQAEKISVTAKAPRALKLNMNTTGFSRQFSDELGTPTEITNIVRMIDENIEEVDEEHDSVVAADMLFKEDSHQRSKPSPPAGRLFLNLPVHPPSNDLPQSSSGSSQEDDLRPSYARVMRQQLPSYRETDFDPTMLEPQTPMTPAGFHTPGTDINTDPLELLRNLNINNDNLNRSAHGHF